MASFGSFETEREVYSGPTYTVYSARKQGDPKTEYAIKVFSVHHIGLEPESAEQLDPLLSDIEKACVDRVAVQQKAAASSKFVAPIFETGRDERGVWYATSFYPRSVNKIISGRVALNREALQHIILSIAQGALDIKRTCGRSHGEILPSNVQISRSEKLTNADVVLSDPMPGGETEAARYELSDLRSIGRIMLQLVSRREINHEEDFLILPILASPEWTQLFEKDTDAWLALVNKLLDPNLSLEQLTLEQLVSELQKLQPETGISPKVLIAAAAGVVVLGIAAFLIMRPRTQTVEVTSDPTGATIFVDKKEQEEKTPLKLKFKKGNYGIEARQDGLRLLEQTTNWVAQGGGSAKLHFQFPYGSVSIKSEPPGASITNNGVVIGTTPMEIPVVASGVEVKYELGMLEHVPRTVRGVVTNGQKLMLSESLPLSRDVGTIDMDSTPRGAKVYLKDKLLVSATPEQVRLEQGTYTLTARYKENEGWPSTELTVEVKKGTVVPANFYFKNGRVVLDSDPPGATVSIGTNVVGTTPVTIPRPAGETTFHFERAGFEPTNETILVADKATARVRPSLLSNNGEFDFTVVPAVAIAHIFEAGGKELGRASEGNPYKTNVPPGQYSFVARVDGLNDVPATLQVQKREIKKYAFVFDCGTVRLETEPPGATISVNGKEIGTTPKTLVQKPGVTVSYQVASLNYIPTVTDVTLKNHEYDKRVPLSLLREPTSVALVSDPPGAEFYTENGVALKAKGEYYNIPWGPTNLVARHGRLGARTNALDIVPGKVNKFDPFKFIYGTLILTNLEGLTVKEGSEEVQNAANSVPVSYEPPGAHTYELYDGAQKVDTLRTNIEVGLVYVLNSAVAGDKRNSIGMKLVKVRNLLGQGKDAWVGKNEVTQKEYKMVMGDNPSDPPVGDDYPVEKVTWLKATEFCQKLTQMDKSPPGPVGKYMLPTAEQWSKFAGGTELKTAVYGATQPAPGGTKGANKYGLNDVLGNVREWLDGSDPKNKDLVGGGFRSRPSFGGMGAFTNAAQVQLDQAFDDLGFRVIWAPGQ
jgi:hypothetical protein